MDLALDGDLNEDDLVSATLVVECLGALADAGNTLDILALLPCTVTAAPVFALRAQVDALSDEGIDGRLARRLSGRLFAAADRAQEQRGEKKVETAEHRRSSMEVYRGA